MIEMCRMRFSNEGGVGSLCLRVKRAAVRCGVALLSATLISQGVPAAAWAQDAPTAPAEAEQATEVRTPSSQEAAESAAPESAAPESPAPPSQTDPVPAPRAPEQVTVTASVIGLSEPTDDGSCSFENWIAPTKIDVEAGQGATAWDIIKPLLDSAGYTYAYANGFLSSITTPEGRELAGKPVSGDIWSFWKFFVNGESSMVGMGDYRVADGDSISLRFSNPVVKPAPEAHVEVVPNAPHPNLEAQWDGYADGGKGSVTTAPTPQEGAQQAWETGFLTPEEVAQGASLSQSDALMIDGKLYVVTGSAVYSTTPPWSATKSLAMLRVIDAATGREERRVQLSAPIDSTCRPVYADGIIVVPLSGGAVQALSAASLQTLWVVPASGQGQSLNSLTIQDGAVYVTYFDDLDANSVASSGRTVRYDLLSGSRLGAIENAHSGSYWTGGIAVGDVFLIGDDAGIVHVYAADLSREISSLKVSNEPLRAALVPYRGFVLAVSRDGVLHKLSMSNHQLRELGSVSFAAYSTSTPTVSGGRAYVGGSGSDFSSRLAIIDLASMTVERVVNAVDGSPMMAGGIVCTPLVSVQQSGTYVYFTINGAEGDYPKYTAGGGIYVYCLGDEDAHVLFEPEAGLKNYCMASILCDPDGNLYYFNDSGHLFKICGSTAIPVDPDQIDLIPLRPALSVQTTSDPANASSGNGGARRVASAAPQSEPELAKTQETGDEPEGESDSKNEPSHRRERSGESTASVNPFAIVGIAAAAVLLASAFLVLFKGAKGRR